MSSRFNSEDYLQYRQGYSRAIFAPLRSSLRPLEGPLHLLDLGAGTGFSTSSFHEFYPHGRFTLLDPDQNMLEAAGIHLKALSIDAEWIHGRSDQIPLPDQSIDGVLVGSAWHWMKQPDTVLELNRVLKPGGWVFVFEYQFPKALPQWSDLNEWIRRQFNLNWKAPSQSPRGSLFEITEVIRGHSQFSQFSSIEFKEMVELSPEFLAGVIFSQSRYQHFEASLSETDRTKDRNEIIASLRERFCAHEVAKFQYLNEGFIFKKRQT